MPPAMTTSHMFPGTGGGPLISGDLAGAVRQGQGSLYRLQGIQGFFTDSFVLTVLIIFIEDPADFILHDPDRLLRLTGAFQPLQKPFLILFK